MYNVRAEHYYDNRYSTLYCIELYICGIIILLYYYIGNDMISQVSIYIVCYIEVGISLIEYSRGRRYIPVQSS